VQRRGLGNLPCASIPHVAEAFDRARHGDIKEQKVVTEDGRDSGRTSFAARQAALEPPGSWWTKPAELLPIIGPSKKWRAIDRPGNAGGRKTRAGGQAAKATKKRGDVNGLT